MAGSAHYRLTPMAQRQLREAKKWSMARWGATLTEQYFTDVHDVAEVLHLEHDKRPSRSDLTGHTG